ncbi:hypothetical protein BDN72DRAFT_789288 [Pluteus cervinus]|uniref:Uncharacterized protein n=1 Tax=Pluteus cervinus TaxID=181527 RepID=A0ACD3B9Z3_9AGAR|nr:hypothetical protein BDN72DRAFT_789288 [Pluteus cervinus]
MSSGTSPDIIKRVETEIAKEGKAEENNLKHAVKDMSNIERAQTKALKAARKAEDTLAKTEKHEIATAKDLNKANYKHDVAITNVNAAQKDVQAKIQQHEKTSKDLGVKKAQVDDMMTLQKRHAEDRERRLSELRGQASGDQGNGNSSPGGSRLPGGF